MTATATMATLTPSSWAAVKGVAARRGLLAGSGLSVVAVAVAAAAVVVAVVLVVVVVMMVVAAAVVDPGSLVGRFPGALAGAGAPARWGPGAGGPGAWETAGAWGTAGAWETEGAGWGWLALEAGGPQRAENAGEGVGSAGGRGM